MKVILITFYIYSSLFGKMGYSGMDVEQFDNLEDCQEAKELVLEVLNSSQKKLDTLSVACEIMREK